MDEVAAEIRLIADQLRQERPQADTARGVIVYAVVDDGGSTHVLMDDAEVDYTVAGV